MSTSPLTKIQIDYQKVLQLSEANVREFFEKVHPEQIPLCLKTIIDAFQEESIPMFIIIEGYDAVLLGALDPKVTLREVYCGKYKATKCVEITVKYSL